MSGVNDFRQNTGAHIEHQFKLLAV